jgi:hypothetical protein
MGDLEQQRVTVKDVARLSGVREGDARNPAPRP